MIFIRWRSCVQCVWCPRLLGGGGGRLPALITRRLEAGGRFPVQTFPATCRDFATCPVPSSCRWSAAARGSGPLITTTNLPNLPPITARHYLHTKVDQIFLRTRKYFWSECETHKHYAVRHLKVFMKWNEIKLQLLFGICWIVAACWMNCFPLSSHCPTSLLVSTQISRSCHCTSKLKYLGVSSEPSRRNETGNLIFLGGEQSGVESIVWQLAKTDE